MKIWERETTDSGIITMRYTVLLLLLTVLSSINVGITFLLRKGDGQIVWVIKDQDSKIYASGTVIKMQELCRKLINSKMYPDRVFKVSQLYPKDFKIIGDRKK
jgi:hypothetical protein